MDPAAIPSPESLEDFFEKEWVRGLFELAVEDLRKHCAANERERTFRLFEEYDLAGEENISYDKLAATFRTHNGWNLTARNTVSRGLVAV